MKKAELTVEQKRADIDLYIIIAATIAVLGFYIGFQNMLNDFSENAQIHILLRTAAIALVQFGIAGLGITIVSVLRKQSFPGYGLKIKGSGLSILLCVLVFIPNIIFLFATGQAEGYVPFQSVWVTKEILSSAFPVNIAGMSMIAVAWGFFEGFNYVVISQTINTRYPSKNKWLNWGAISCGILCLLIHGMVGVTLAGIVEAVTVFIIVYGMLMVKEFTHNAWGCVFIFVFLWNAF